VRFVPSLFFSLKELLFRFVLSFSLFFSSEWTLSAIRCSFPQSAFFSTIFDHSLDFFFFLSPFGNLIAHYLFRRTFLLYTADFSFFLYVFSLFPPAFFFTFAFFFSVFLAFPSLTFFSFFSSLSSASSTVHYTLHAILSLLPVTLQTNFLVDAPPNPSGNSFSPSLSSHILNANIPFFFFSFFCHGSFFFTVTGASFPPFFFFLRLFFFVPP